MGTGIEMAEFRVHLPNGEFENFKSKVQYKYAVVERCGQKECHRECNGEWLVVRKSKSWKGGRNAFDSFRFNYQNGHYEYELVQVEEVLGVKVDAFDVELFDFVVAVGGNYGNGADVVRANQFYQKFKVEMEVKYGSDWFNWVSKASAENRKAKYAKKVA